VIQLATPPVLVDADVILRLAIAALAGVLAALSISPALELAILAAALVAPVVVELARHERHTAMAEPL
jgi:hypothetical protein